MNRSRRFFIKDTELSGKLRMQERTVARCGFCSMLSGLLRRAMCVSSRRDSSESYYRELGDQDTLKIEDRVSELSDNVDIQDEEQTRLEVHPQPEEEVLQIETVMKPKSLADGRFLTIHKRRKKSLLTRSLENNCALLDDLSLGQVQCILNQSVTWRFNAFTLDVVSGGRCLPVLCMHLFHMYGLYTHFKLDVAKTWKLFSMIEERYHSTNPYHNSIHAADVTQAMHCFLQQDRIRDHLQPLEILASLLAAIAHDMDHPGVNQPFLIATSNHLATLYQNTSVLENHHWRSAISCLIESGILDQMQETRPALEKQISSLILATDITRQQEFLCQFKRYLDSSTLDMTKAEHRHLVLQIALKCADISNPCRSWEISQKWSLKVCEEFFRQGDYERKLNLPVSALCDRHSTSIPKIQTGFFKFVVTPLIKEWDRFLKNDLSSQMLSNLLYNQNKWDSLVAEELAREESSNEISDADMVDYDLDTRSGTSNSESSELLLPPRRCSLNPTKPGGLRDELRRFSVPLNIFQDTKFKTRGDSNRAHLLVGLQRGDNASHPGSSQGTQETPEKVLSTENLLPDSSIASITTPVQATRLSTVIRDCGNWKLVRQQTFPPLEPARDHPPSRSLHTSNEDTISHVKADLPRFDLTSCRKDGKFSNLFTRLGTDKTDNIAAGSQTNVESAEPRRSVHKESETKRRKSVEVGSQLRDNLTSVQLGGLDSDHLLRRRTSMPADVITLTSKEKKGRELAAVLPQFLCRTVTGKDSWTHRRGSAPSPIAPSEMRGLASLGALCHSTNGGRRKPNPLATCQQWLTKATYNVQETFQHMPRRSSLPVEVYRPAESGRTTDKPK